MERQLTDALPGNLATLYDGFQAAASSWAAAIAYEQLLLNPLTGSASGSGSGSSGTALPSAAVAGPSATDPAADPPTDPAADPVTEPTADRRARLQGQPSPPLADPEGPAPRPPALPQTEPAPLADRAPDFAPALPPERLPTERVPPAPAPQPQLQPPPLPQPIPAGAAPGYRNARGASGELVPYGTWAVWQGRDISSAGNVGLGSYAFLIDSGVDGRNGDLNLNTAWSRSWIPGQDAFTDGADHGTHVAGTIGALANGSGIVGVAPGAEIISLKVLDDRGWGQSSDVLAAIDYAVALITTHQLDLRRVVVNLSLGGSPSPGLDGALRSAADRGIRFSVAAGNEGGDADGSSPASSGDHPGILTVSAVDASYTMAAWSNWDQVDASDPLDCVDVAAPGVAVLSYDGNGQLVSRSGTSMAAPHVAGLLLLGGVREGDPVHAAAGCADPFALGARFPDAGGDPSDPVDGGAARHALVAPVAVAEARTLAITIATHGVAAGTRLTWSLSGDGIDRSDLAVVGSDPAAGGTDTAADGLNGSLLVGEGGMARLELRLAGDAVSEGDETLQVSLYDDASRSRLVASRTITIQDSSRAPLAERWLWGTAASDTVRGGEADEALAGVPAGGGDERGRGQIDRLIGGGGADTFLLADADGVFYDDGIVNNLGQADHARIEDFTPGEDRLQVAGQTVFFRYGSGDTSVFWDSNANGRFDGSGTSRDELIALVVGQRVSAADLL